MYIAACEIARKKPIGFRPYRLFVCLSSAFDSLYYSTDSLTMQCVFSPIKALFSNQIAFLHLSITLLYYSFTILYSPEQLHVCNLPDAIVPYIGIKCAARRCSLLFMHPDALPSVQEYTMADRRLQQNFGQFLWSN